MLEAKIALRHWRKTFSRRVSLVVALTLFKAAHGGMKRVRAKLVLSNGFLLHTLKIFEKYSLQRKSNRFAGQAFEKVFDSRIIPFAGQPVEGLLQRNAYSISKLQDLPCKTLRLFATPQN